MDTEARIKIREQIDALAYSWKAAERVENNKAAALKLREDFATMATDFYLGHYIRKMDCSSSSGTEYDEMRYQNRLLKLMKAINNYDDACGPFSHYAAVTLMNTHVNSDTAAFMNKRDGGNTIVSLDSPYGDSDEHGILSDFIAADEEMDDKENLYLEMAASILALRSRLNRSNDDTFWHRLVFTELVSTYAALGHCSSLHEKEILSATSIAYMDYYFNGEARKLADIAQLPLRRYGDIVPKCPASKADDIHWMDNNFPADVSAFYVYWHLKGEDFELGAHRNNVTYRRRKFGEFLQNCGVRI